MKYDLEVVGAFKQIEASTEKEAKQILYKQLSKILDQFVILSESEQIENKKNVKEYLLNT